MSNLIYHCGCPGCLVCGPRRFYTPDSERRTAEIMRRGMASMERWRKREAERLRRLYPEPSPLRRLIEEIGGVLISKLGHYREIQTHTPAAPEARGVKG